MKSLSDLELQVLGKVNFPRSKSAFYEKKNAGKLNFQLPAKRAYALNRLKV